MTSSVVKCSMWIRTLDPISRGLKRGGIGTLLALSAPIRTLDPISRGLKPLCEVQDIDAAECIRTLDPISRGLKLKSCLQSQLLAVNQNT